MQAQALALYHVGRQKLLAEPMHYRFTAKLSRDKLFETAEEAEEYTAAHEDLQPALKRGELVLVPVGVLGTPTAFCTIPGGPPLAR